MGAGQLQLGDEELTIIFPGRPADETAFAIPYDAIETVGTDEVLATVVTRDGARLSFATSDAGALRAAILTECRALPELTRALRAMGSRRIGARERPRALEDEVRYFAPFLAARRAAAHAASPRQAIAAFEPVALTTALDATLGAFATDRAGNRLPRWRAIEAELSELADPVRVALAEPRAAGDRARVDDVDDLARWRAWVGAHCAPCSSPRIVRGSRSMPCSDARRSPCRNGSERVDDHRSRYRPRRDRTHGAHVGIAWRAYAHASLFRHRG